MSTGRIVRIIIMADDKASKVFDKVAGNLDKSSSKLDKIQAKMQSAGKSLTKHVTAPLLAVGAVSIKSAVDFQTSMERIHTQAGGTQADVEKLSKAVLNMKGSQQGPQAVAESLYHLKSVGMGNAAAMRAVKKSMDLANLSGADLEETTNAVAGAWRTGIPGAKSFGAAAATLNAIVGAGNMRMQDLNDAMGTGFLASAKIFGLSLKQVGGALALFTDEGTPANVAATRLRMSFSLLGAPSSKANKALQSIGLNGTKLAKAMRSPGGLVATIGLLREHMHGMNKVAQAQFLSHAFGGGRSSSAIMSMINNFSVLKQKMDQVNANASKFGPAVKAQAKTAQARFAMVKVSAEQLGIKLGNFLIPVVEKLIGWVTKVADWFNNLSPSMQKTIVTIGAIVAAIGPVLLIGAKLIEMCKAIGVALDFLEANPMVAVVAAIVAIGVALVALYKHSETFRNIVNGVWHSVEAGAKWLWHALKDVFGGIEVGAKVLWKILKGIFEVWMIQVGLVAAAVQAAWQHIIKPAFHAIADGAKWLWQNVLKPIFDVIAFQWRVTATVLRDVYNGMIAPVIHVFGAAFSAVWRDVIRPVFHMIEDGWRVVVGGIERWAGKLASGVGKAVGGLWGVVRQPVNWIIDGLNAVIAGLDSISVSIPSWVPMVGGKSFGVNIPEIPHLATGGMTTTRTLAVIGDNPSGNEVVMPMDSPRTIDALAAALGKAGAERRGGDGRIADTVNIYESGDPVRTAREVARYQRARAAV